MNRILYMVIPAMLLAVACDKGPECGYPDLVPISFGSDVASETVLTRAGGIGKLEDVANSFVVTGYKNTAGNTLEDVITNYKVSYVTGTEGSSTTNTSGWEYVGQGTDQVVKYWDYSAAGYRFVAYVPKQEGGAVDYSCSMAKDGNSIRLTLDGLPVVAVSASGDATVAGTATAVQESDLPMVSKLWKGTPPQQGPVRLEFIKPYAKLCIEISRTDGFAAQNVTGMQLSRLEGQIPNPGTLVLNYPLLGNGGISASCSGSAGTPSISFDDVSADELANADVPCPLYPQYLLCPDTYNTMDYVFTLHCNEESRKCQIPASKMQLDPGYSYRFIFKLTSVGLDFGLADGLQDFDGNPLDPASTTRSAASTTRSAVSTPDFNLDLFRIVRSPLTE